MTATRERQKELGMALLTMAWGKMAYTDAGGTGRPLLFLHGSGCDSTDWEGVIAGLPPGLRSVCMDFRGHGASDAPGRAFGLSQDDLADDVLAVLDRLDLRDVVLVGHSLGGCVAMMAAPRTNRVTALILLEGWTNSRAAEIYSDARLFGGLDAFAIRRIETKLVDTIRRVGPGAWKQLSESGSDFDGLPYLQGVRIPVVEVYGEVGRTPDTERRLDIPPNPFISLEWIEGAGHYVPHAKPGEVARICGEAALKKQGHL
jgi:pimeloyl-ACP methyl ester carboxylesterase